MPSRSLGGRRARKPLALPPCRQTTGRTAGQRSIRVTGLGEVYPGEPRCAPHDHCASTCASTASVYGSQTVIPMAREVVRWCGGTPHALLGLGGMRLWAARGVMLFSCASFAAAFSTRAAWHASGTRRGSYGRRYPRSHASRKDTPMARDAAIRVGSRPGNRTSAWVHGAARPRCAPGAIAYASGSRVVPDG